MDTQPGVERQRERRRRQRNEMLLLLLLLLRHVACTLKQMVGAGNAALIDVFNVSPLDALTIMRY